MEGQAVQAGMLVDLAEELLGNPATVEEGLPEGPQGTLEAAEEEEDHLEKLQGILAEKPEWGDQAWKGVQEEALQEFRD